MVSCDDGEVAMVGKCNRTNGWKGRAHRGGENRASISGLGVSFLGERLGLSQLLAWKEEKKMHMCLGIRSEE